MPSGLQGVLLLSIPSNLRASGEPSKTIQTFRKRNPDCLVAQLPGVFLEGLGFVLGTFSLSNTELKGTDCYVLMKYPKLNDKICCLSDPLERHRRVF